MRATSISWSSFLRYFLGTTLLVLVATGACNVFFDPLGVFGSPRLAGLNAIKPYLNHHQELARHVAACRLAPDTGIFGNSRSEVGLDPESPAIKDHGLSACSLAIPGIDAWTVYRQLLWLQAAGRLPRTIFLGVEFFDFLGGAAAKPLPTLATQPAPRIDPRFLGEDVFSLIGLRDSCSTLLAQRARYPAITTERGFNPLLEYIPEVAQSGHYALFRQRAQENVRNWLRKPRRIRAQDGTPCNDEIDLDAILRLTTAAGCNVHLLMYPYHAQNRMLVERLGLGGLLQDWKRLVVTMANGYAEHGAKVDIWDFSGIAPETLEPIPPKGDHHTRLVHYWEAGHFKKALGDMVLARILGQEGSFGIRLDSRNLDEWLERDRRQVQDLLATPSPLRDEVEDIVAHAPTDSRP